MRREDCDACKYGIVECVYTHEPPEDVEPSPQEGAELPACECYPSGDEPWPTECEPCAALKRLRITREEWARLQAVDAELGESRAACKWFEEINFNLMRNADATLKAQLAELRTRLTEAEGRAEKYARGSEIHAVKHSEAMEQRDTERARADKAEADLANADGAMQCIARGRLSAAARIAALQKRVAELEGERGEWREESVRLGSIIASGEAG